MQIHRLPRKNEPDKKGYSGKFKRYLLGLAILSGLFAAGCTQGVLSGGHLLRDALSADFQVSRTP